MEIKKIASAIEYSEERLTKRVLFKEGGSAVFMLNFAPGQSLPEHTHPGSELFLTVMEGKGTLLVNDERHPVGKGDVVHCSGEERFAFENDGGMNTSFYVVLSKLPGDEYAKNV